MSSMGHRIRRVRERFGRRRSASKADRVQRRVAADAVRLEHKRLQGSKFIGGGGGGG